ncbi:glucokinase [Mortierella claussenii]|nr:glucokinase [Mortierella claussenii]
MLSAPVATNPVPKLTRLRLDSSTIPFISDVQRLAIADLIEQFTLESSELKNIKDHFVQELLKGLTNENQTVAMVPVFVSGRLNGSETGSYLTLDIGGTYLRVVAVALMGQGQVKMQQKKYTIEEELKMGEAKLLFNYMSDCVSSFMDEYAISVPPGSEIELGFTFSFPVQQASINSGTLIAWTKGFNCQGIVDKDPAALLQDAFKRRGIPVRVAALLNDTVGTLLAHAYLHRNTVIGLGLGTGSNAAYVERASRITKRSHNRQEISGKEMVVNMEFGAFDSERRVLPLTKFDNKVDRKSLNPDKQIFEKMIAGMYLGEIVRNILLDLIDCRLLFGGHSTHKMNQVWAFDTAYMSTIEADSTVELDRTQFILESYLGFNSFDEASVSDAADVTTVAVTLTDRAIVKLVVGLVGRRAARLSAVALAGILEHTRGVTWSEEQGGADIGVDGSLYRYYPGFADDIQDALKEIFKLEAGSGVGDGETDKIRFGLSLDGSGVGAALCALLATKAC